MENSTLSEPLRRFVVRMAWASLVPIGMLLVAMALKPMWRDEFWSIYFSEPRFSLFELWGDRMRYESHPPLYFTLLRLWRGIADTEFWMRALAVPIVLVGALGAYLIGRGRREIGLYLLICIGSYWLIYFATEARPYLLLFMLCAWLTLIAAKLLDNPKASPLWYVLWVVVGAAIGMTHYPAALWLGCIGLAAGIGFLAQKRPGAFFAIGAASAIALAPVLYWLSLSVPLIGHGGGLGAPGPDQWQSFLTQLSRGLTVKLLGSNLAITCAAFAGIVALWRSKSVLDRVIVGSALLFIAGAAALDLFYAPMMRERSFMAMIPSLLLLMTRAVLSVDPERPWARRFLVAAPIMAAISPFLFIPEYFKNRERLDELRAFVADEAGDCAGSPVVAFMRESWGHDIYPREVIDRQMRQAVPGREPPLILAPRQVTGPLSPNPGCRLRGIALTLRPGYREHHEAALAALREAGLDPEQLEEIQFGKGRNMLWVTPAEGAPQPTQPTNE